MGNDTGVCGTVAAEVAWTGIGRDTDADRHQRGRSGRRGLGSGEDRGELTRLRQLGTLSTKLAQALSMADIVDLLATSVASDCGADTSVVYLIDPDQDDVLRLAAAKGLPEGRIGPALLCRDGGAL